MMVYNPEWALTLQEPFPMSIHDVFLRWPLLSEAAKILQEQKMYVTVGHDFNEYARIVSQGRPHQPVSLPFRAEHHNLSKNNAFWVCGHTEEGVLAHTQAVRMVDMGEASLGGYMRRSFRQFPPAGVALDMAASRYRAGPGAKRIKGRVCYHGEMWLDESAGDFRGRGLSSVLSRMGFAIALRDLDPDYIFAFMVRSVAFKGLVERAGFMHSEPASLSWKLADKDRAIEAFTAYLSREDLRYLLRIRIDDLVH